MNITDLLNKINSLILNPLISLAFAISLLVFFWGLIQFIRSETADSKRGEGLKKITYGLLGMLIMISAYGIIRFLLGIFGITPGYPIN